MKISLVFFSAFRHSRPRMRKAALPDDPRVAAVDGKACAKCKRFKSADQFSFRAAKSSLLGSYCHGCLAANQKAMHAVISVRAKRYYQANREQILKRISQYRARNREKSRVWQRANYYRNKEAYKRRSRERLLRPGIKEKCAVYQKMRRHLFPEQTILLTARARAKKMGLEFSISVGDIQIPAICPVLGIPIVCTNPARKDDSPSIDRINPLLGYIPKNIRIISWRANRLKSDSSPEELRRLLDYVLSNTVSVTKQSKSEHTQYEFKTNRHW